jgi:D-3-phosphoglycerate dehydrogenase
MRIDDRWSEEAIDLLPRGNYLITSLNRRYVHSELKGFDFIASCTTGTDHIDNKDIPLLSLQGETDFLSDVHATAEHVFALILSLIRRVTGASEDVRKGNWNREAWQGTELHGKTLGIIGYGRVGKQVAKIAKGFGMEILKYDKGDDLWAVLSTSDIVTVHLSLNEDTDNLFGPKEFTKMKNTAYFINTSRGAIVNEEALIEALQNKKIAGTAIDVIEREPTLVPWKNVLDHIELNLIITPHLGGNTVESRKKTQLFMAGKVVDYVKGGNKHVNRKMGA